MIPHSTARTRRYAICDRFLVYTLIPVQNFYSDNTSAAKIYGLISVSLEA